MDDNYQGNVWACGTCKEVIRTHWIERCPRCNRFVRQVQGEPFLEGDEPSSSTKDKRRLYANAYYHRVTKFKRARAKGATHDK